MFRTVALSIITSFSLYTQQWYMSYRFADSLRAGSGRYVMQVCWQLEAVNKPLWHIPLLCVQWKTRDDGQSNSPKHVEFYSKNKIEKLVHLVGFIIRIYHDARSPDSQILFVVIIFGGTLLKENPPPSKLKIRCCLLRILGSEHKFLYK